MRVLYAIIVKIRCMDRSRVQVELIRIMILRGCSLGALIDMASSALDLKCPLEKPTTTYRGSAPIISLSFKFHAVRSMQHSLQVSVNKIIMLKFWL